MGLHSLDPMFNPKSIAVFGATGDGLSPGDSVIASLRLDGFSGDILPISVTRTQIDGLPCTPAISDLRREIDLAVITGPIDCVPGLLRECGASGIRHAIILSTDYHIQGPSARAFDTALQDIIHEYGIRILGPNGVGLIRPQSGLRASFLKSDLPKGRLALVSQSSALCSAIADRARHQATGFSTLISLSNSQDVDFGDVLSFLATDPKTTAILLYLENLRNARSFLSGLRLAAQLKPVIVLKSGRRDQGLAAASTHTGLQIGDDAVFDAAFERTGAVRVETFGQLFAAAEVLAETKRAAGPRLAVITNGGGAGVLAADSADTLGLVLSTPSSGTLAALDSACGTDWSRANPIDIRAEATPEDYATAVQAALKDPAFDGVVAMMMPQAFSDPTAAAIALCNPYPKGPASRCWSAGWVRLRSPRPARSSTIRGFRISPRPKRRSRLLHFSPVIPSTISSRWRCPAR